MCSAPVPCLPGTSHLHTPMPNHPPPVPLQLANKLNNAVKNLDRDPLAVFVQINSSGEESKFGVEPADCVQLARHVHTQCDQLRLQGLMTIGMADYQSRPENFKVRKSSRSSLALSPPLTMQNPWKK